MTDPGPPVFDPEHLATMCGDDPAFQSEIAGEFLAQLDREVENIAKAVGSGGATAVHQAAHALKGSASTLGAPALAAACGELESLGRRGDLGAADQALARIRHEAGRLRAVLERFLSDLAA